MSADWQIKLLYQTDQPISSIGISRIFLRAYLRWGLKTGYAHTNNHMFVCESNHIVTGLTKLQHLKTNFFY